MSTRGSGGGGGGGGGEPKVNYNGQGEEGVKLTHICWTSFMDGPLLYIFTVMYFITICHRIIYYICNQSLLCNLLGQ